MPPISAAATIASSASASASEHTPISERRHNYQEVGQTPSEPPAPNTATTSHRRRKTYRGGFHTSICDIFRDPHSRTDCCAVVCCGVFASDRNRYLLTGERPPPLWLRVLMYFIVPVLLIGVIGYFAVDVPVFVVVVENDGDGDGDGDGDYLDSEQTQKAPRLSTVLAFFAYIIFISIWGRWVSSLMSIMKSR